jgi:hypothetical protein
MLQNSKFKGLLILFQLCVISGFRHEVDDNCPLLVYYAASSGNLLPTFRDIFGPIFRSHEFFFLLQLYYLLIFFGNNFSNLRILTRGGNDLMQILKWLLLKVIIFKMEEACGFVNFG